MPTPGQAALDRALEQLGDVTADRLRVMKAHFVHDARIVWRSGPDRPFDGPSRKYSEGASLSWFADWEYAVYSEDMHLLDRVVDEERTQQEAQLLNLADMQVGDVAVIRARHRLDSSAMRYDGAIVLFVFNDRGDGFTFVCIDPGTSQARRGRDTWVCRSGQNLHAFRFQKINMTLEGLT